MLALWNIILDVPKPLIYRCGTRGFVMKSVLSDKHFHNEAAAYAFVEARLWPNGLFARTAAAWIAFPRWAARAPDRHLQVLPVPQALYREGWDHLRGQPRSHASLVAGDLPDVVQQEGISSHQLHRTLGCTLKTAWFISHRIREAMRATGGGPWRRGRGYRSDETFIGRIEGQPKARAGYGHKNVVLTLVRRGGEARSFHVDSTTIADIVPSCAPTSRPKLTS